MSETHSYPDAVALPVVTIAREFAEIVDGPWYEWDPRVTAAVEPHIPSDRDLMAQFRARLEKQVPGTECMSGKGCAGRYLVVDGESYKRTHRYLRVRLPMEHIAHNTSRLADVVRRAYFEAAELLADTIALQVAEMRIQHERVAVRWLPSGLMHQGTADERRRLGVDAYTDTAVALIAAYYVVAPVGKDGWA